MKIYEKPSMEIKKFETEDIMVDSGNYGAANAGFVDTLGTTEAQDGVVFQW